YIEEQTEKRVAKKAGTPAENQSQTFSIPVILKADASGSLEALVKEISKVKNDRAAYHVIASGIGPITEKDVKLALTDDRPILVGFNVSTDTRAKHLALREGVTPETFDIIYKLTEWLSAELSKRTPKVRTEEISGTAKILKAF